MQCLFSWRLAPRSVVAGAAVFLLAVFSIRVAGTTTNVAFGGATTAQYNFRPADVTIRPGDTGPAIL